MSPPDQNPGAVDRPGVQFLEFLKLQRAHNRRGFAQKSARMSELWSAIADGKGDTDALLELERLARCLAGSGATFAFCDLEVGARALELAVRRLLDGSGSPSAEQCAEIKSAVLTVQSRIPTE
jgi:hypothetical protein